MSAKDLLASQVWDDLNAKEAAQNLVGQIVQDDGPVTEASPWLDMTRWPQYARGYKLSEIAPLAYAPDPVTEPLLVELAHSIDRIVDAAHASIREDKINVFDQVRINSFMQRPRAFDKPIMIKLREESYRNYKGAWKQLIAFAYRSTRLDEPIQLPHRLTTTQLAALDRMICLGQHLIERRQQGVGATDACADSGRCVDVEVKHAQASLDRECLLFCIALLDHTLKGNLFESVAVGFLAVLGINESKGIFKDAYSYTPTLSK